MATHAKSTPLHSTCTYFVNVLPSLPEQQIAQSHSNRKRGEMCKWFVADNIHVLVEMCRLQVNEQRYWGKIVDKQQNTNSRH